MPTNPAWVEHTERAAWDTVGALRAEIARDKQTLERLVALEPSLPKLAVLLDEAKRQHALEGKSPAEILEKLIGLLGSIKTERDELRLEVDRLRTVRPKRLRRRDP